MIKLYKLDISPPARAVMIACKLFNVPLELIEVDLSKGEHLSSEFLKKNPLHAVPVLEDGSLVIHDSHAILKYLADAYGKQDSVYPKDPKLRALVDQKLFFNATILYYALRDTAVPIWIEGCKVVPQKRLDAIEDAFAFVEEFLSRTKYLAADNITIADIAAYTTVCGLTIFLELNVQKYPKTNAWLKELEKLPYFEVSFEGHQLYKQAMNSLLGK